MSTTVQDCWSDGPWNPNMSWIDTHGHTGLGSEPIHAKGSASVGRMATWTSAHDCQRWERVNPRGKNGSQRDKRVDFGEGDSSRSRVYGRVISEPGIIHGQQQICKGAVGAKATELGVFRLGPVGGWERRERVAAASSSPFLPSSKSSVTSSRLLSSSTLIGVFSFFPCALLCTGLKRDSGISEPVFCFCILAAVTRGIGGE